MPLLRLRQLAEAENRYLVHLELESEGARRTAESRFEFKVSVQDQEDVRWYLEDYLQYPLDPAPTIAGRIEARMAEIGVELFQAVLGKTPLWHEVRHDLSDTRIEIATTVKEATAIPWELLRDPEADVPLALLARAFVRAQHDAVKRAKPPRSPAGPIRVLLAICRPRGRADVPFRSVAKRLLEGLRDSEAVRLTLLRPPTFEQLARTLRSAKAEGNLTTWSTSMVTAFGRRAGRARAGTATCCSKTRRWRKTSSLWMGRRWAAFWPKPACRCWC
jgi:hypothetical protein